MKIEEIVNSQKASEAAMMYWNSLPEEYQSRINNLGPEPDVIDAYEEGVLYGLNNPNWIPVEDGMPPENGKTQQSISVWATDGLMSGEFRYNFDTKTWTDMWGDPFDITHWMPLPQPPRKEDKE
jgi:hypothetical protein